MNETCPTCGGTGTVPSPEDVRGARIGTGLTLREVAEAMRVGHPYVSHVERGFPAQSTPQARRRVYDAIMAIAARKRGGA